MNNERSDEIWRVQGGTVVGIYFGNSNTVIYFIKWFLKFWKFKILSIFYRQTVRYRFCNLAKITKWTFVFPLPQTESRNLLKPPVFKEKTCYWLLRIVSCGFCFSLYQHLVIVWIPIKGHGGQRQTYISGCWLQIEPLTRHCTQKFLPLHMHPSNFKGCSA